ncbi:metallophosphoesterase [bacterium]|nr:metallophosphoesterase [bacterium]
MKISRRKLLRYSLAAGCLGLGGYVWQIEPSWTAYEKRELQIPNLSNDLIGKTLIQFSDLHIGRKVADNYLSNQFAYVKSLRPDFVVYTGDFIDDPTPYHLNKLQRLASEFPLGSIGTAGVLGNHDYVRTTQDCTMADKVINELNDSGVNVLLDSTINFGGLTIAGLDDLWSPRFAQGRCKDVVQSLSGPSIVLSHNPDSVDLPIWNGYSSWVLCGHTHGGQCRIPGFAPPFLPVRNRNYVAGSYQLKGGHKMYINRGLGHSMKVRFFVRPEITVFTLAKA